VTTPANLFDAIGARPPGRPAFSEAEQAQIEAFQAAERELGVAERETCLAYAWLLCTCIPRYTPVDQQTPPNYAHCLVHGQHMITHDGRWL
jgi:hypothetical protein